MAPQPAAGPRGAIEGMMAALDDEIAAARRSGGRFALGAGERAAVEAGGFHPYAFAGEWPMPLRDDTPIRLLAGGKEVPGFVVSLRDRELVVALAEDLGPHVHGATLVADHSGLLAALRGRLKAVADGAVQAFHPETAGLVLGAGFRRTTGSAVPPPDWLNADQRSAVERAQACNATFIWGPPGTGKTATLAGLIATHMRAGRSVLVVACTNQAVDELGRRIVRDVPFADGAVLRVGPADPALGERIGFDAVRRRRAVALEAEQAKLAAERRTLAAEAEELQSALAVAAEAERLRERLPALGRNVTRSRQQRADAQAAAAAAAGRAAEVRERLEAAARSTPIGRWLAGLSLPRCQAALEEARARVSVCEADVLRADAEQRQAVAALRDARERLRVLEARTGGQAPRAWRRRLEEVGVRGAAVAARLQDVVRALRSLGDRLLAEAGVVLTTTTRLALPGQLPARSFDAAIIDEASMVPVPAAYLAAGLATTSVVLAGDFRQLPPIVRSDSPTALEWLRASPFDRAGIPQAVEGDAVPCD